MDAIRVPATRPVLEITQERARLHISNNMPQMRMRHTRPTMKIDRTDPSFRVDWSEVYDQIRGNPGLGFSPERTARANRRTQEAIGQITSVGEALAHPEEGNTVASVVKQLAKKPVPEVELKTLDLSTPVIQWDNSHMSIEWTDYALDIEWDGIGAPQIEVEQYSIEVRIRNQPIVRFSMDPDGAKKRESVGAKIDEKV